MRYLLEQFNGLVKNDVLKECWVRPKGLIKKASMVTAGIIGVDANAIRALIQGETSLKNVSKYWTQPNNRRLWRIGTPNQWYTRCQPSIAHNIKSGKTIKNELCTHLRVNNKQGLLNEAFE